MLKLSSTSYFKYFVINFARETNALLVGDLLTRLLYLYMKQANESKGNLSITLFFIFLSDTKTYFKNIHWSCSIKKAVPKYFGVCKGKCVGVRTVARHLLYSHLRFSFSWGKTLNISSNFIINVFCKNVECKVMVTEVYLEPS